MNNVFLVEPSMEYERQYKEMVTTWTAISDDLVPWVLKLDCTDFRKFITYLNNIKNGIDLSVRQVKCSTFFLIKDDGLMLGASNVRHEINKKLYFHGGHIGYGIRPDHRNAGYATELLRLSLLEAASLGIKKVRITCEEGNVASERVISKNGGVFDTTIIDDDKLTKRYWIQT